MLSVSLASERELFNSLTSTRFSFSDQLIIIHELTHIFSYIQQLIYIIFFQHEKALLVAERERSSALARESSSISSPVEDSLALFKAMQHYCRLESSAILYIFDYGSEDNPTFCWLLLPDIKELLFFNIEPENTESDLSVNQDFKITNKTTRSIRSDMVLPALLNLPLGKENFIPEEVDEEFRKFKSFKTGVEKYQCDTAICNLLNDMWKETSYHLGLTSAKRLIIIPQLRFYNERFCLMGKSDDTMSICNYPVLNKFIITHQCQRFVC